MNGFYTTKDGLEFILYPYDTLLLSYMNIIELDIPSGTNFIYCDSNLLTKLIIPNSVKLINCRNNQLTELIVPDDCDVYCDESVNVITRTMFNRSNRLKNILK